MSTDGGMGMPCQEPERSGLADGAARSLDLEAIRRYAEADQIRSQNARNVLALLDALTDTEHALADERNRHELQKNVAKLRLAALTEAERGREGLTGQWRLALDQQMAERRRAVAAEAALREAREAAESSERVKDDLAAQVVQLREELRETREALERIYWAAERAIAKADSGGLDPLLVLAYIRPALAVAGDEPAPRQCDQDPDAENGCGCVYECRAASGSTGTGG